MIRVTLGKCQRLTGTHRSSVVRQLVSFLHCGFHFASVLAFHYVRQDGFQDVPFLRRQIGLLQAVLREDISEKDRNFRPREVRDNPVSKELL